MGRSTSRRAVAVVARRPIEKKKVRRLRKLLRTPTETFIDPVQWLKDRGHAQTSGEARRLVLDGRLKSESHTVGIQQVRKINEAGTHYVRDPKTGEFEMEDAVALVPARLRSTLRVA